MSTEESSWSERVDGTPLDSDAFEHARAAATEVTEVYGHAVPYFQSKQLLALQQGFLALEGDVPSPLGIFGMLEDLTPQMVTQTEMAWFRAVAKYYQRMCNSVLGRMNLDDVRPPTPEEVNSMNYNKKTVISHIHRNKQAIDTAFPPPQLAVSGS